MTVALLPDTISCRMNRDYMEKRANPAVVSAAKAAWPFLRKVLGGAALGTGLGEVGMLSTGEGYEGQTKGQILGRIIFNAGLGGASAGIGGTAFTHAMVGIPVKDLALNVNASGVVNKLKESAEANIETSKKNNLAPWLLGGLGLGALGLGGLALYKYWNQKDPVAAKNGARLRYRLAGDDALPGREAEVDIPISSPDITDKMLENLDSGMRRQLRKTIKLNSRKKDPVTGKLISYDAWTDKYGEHGEFLPDKYKTDETMMDLEKASSYAEDRARVAGYTWYVMTKCAEQLPPPEDPAAGQPPAPPQQTTPGNQATQQVSPEAEGKAHAPQRSSRTSSIDKIENAVHGVHSTLAHMSNKESIRLSAQANASVARQPWDDLKNRIASMGGQQ